MGQGGMDYGGARFAKLVCTRNVSPPPCGCSACAGHLDELAALVSLSQSVQAMRQGCLVRYPQVAVATLAAAATSGVETLGVVGSRKEGKMCAHHLPEGLWHVPCFASHSADQGGVAGPQHV